MFNIGDVVVKLKADSTDLKKGFNEAGSHSNSLGNKLGLLAGGAKVFAAGAVAAGTAAVGFGLFAVKAFNESEKATAQLEAVLKSTAGAAGVTKEAALGLAQGLQKVTTFDDEAILGGENLLLTFTKIGKDIFPQATETMLDMSQALGQDVKSSAVQLGKALQDPIQGITALRRVGVNFSEDQQKVIARLVETGQTAEAQRLILKELNTEFGGSARKAADTFGGQVTQLKNQFGDFMEVVGEFLASKLKPLVQGFLNWVDSMGGVEGIFERIKEIGRTAFDGIKQGIQVLKDLWQRFQELPGAAQLLLYPIAFLVVHFEAFKEVVRKLVDIFMTWFWPSIQALGRTLRDELWPALQQVWQSLQRLWESVQPALGEALKWLGMIIGAILVVAIWLLINGVKWLAQGLAFAASIIANVINWISNLIKWIGNVIGVIINIDRAWREWLGRMIAALINMVREVDSWFRSLPGKIRNAVGGLGNLLYGAGRDVLNGLLNGVKNIWGSVSGWLGGIGGRIKNTVGNLMGVLWDAGWHALNSLFSGMKSAWNGVKNWLGSLAGQIKNLKGPIDKDKVMLLHEGRAIMDGLNTGLLEGFRNVRSTLTSFTGEMGGFGLGGNFAPATGGRSSVVNNSPSTHIEKIEIGSPQDAEYWFNKIDRNSELEIMGGSPQ